MEEKVNLFAQTFKGYLRGISERYSEYRAREYADAVNKRLYSQYCCSYARYKEIVRRYPFYLFYSGNSSDNIIWHCSSVLYKMYSG